MLAAAIPFLAILNSAVRRDALPFRILGTLVLIGIALHIAWLTLPAFGYAGALPALLSAIVILLVRTAAQPWIASMRLRHG
jgi:hypothetical protein